MLIMNAGSMARLGPGFFATYEQVFAFTRSRFSPAAARFPWRAFLAAGLDWPKSHWLPPLLLLVLIVFLVWSISLRRDIRELTAVLLRRMQIAVHEITERQREAETLRESEERFRQLAENMRDIVWIVSLETHQTLFINRVFEEITGRTCQSLWDRANCLDLVHAEDRAQVVYALFRQVLENDPGDAEFRIIRPDGHIRWIRCRAFPILKSRGETRRAGCIAEDITVRKRSEGDLRRVSARLLRLQDEERRRMARELHDSTAQTLTALVLNLTTVQKPAGRLSEKVRVALRESLALARQCSREVRTLSYLLHPPLLDELGLVSALRHFLDGYMKRSGIQVAMEVSRNFSRLPQEIELALFRVVQESLTNIHRHSGSATARVRLAQGARTVRLEVEDEGKGLPAEMMDDAKPVLPGLGVGIAGMRERMKQLGGLLEIESSNRGTTVSAMVPFPLHHE